MGYSPWSLTKSDRLTHTTFLKMGLKICCVTLLAVGEELIKYDSWAFKNLFVNRLVLSFTEFYFLKYSRFGYGISPLGGSYP